MVDHPVNDVYSFHCADTQLFRSDVILLQGRPLEGQGSVQVRSGACLHAQRALAAAPQRLLDALAAEAVRARCEHGVLKCIEVDDTRRALIIRRVAHAIGICSRSSARIRRSAILLRRAAAFAITAALRHARWRSRAVANT